jgi:hypothetical protein
MNVQPRPLRAAHPDVAARLRKVRTMYGPTVTEFCQSYGFSVTQWVNYEAGFLPSLAAARQLKGRIHGLTLDWIYDGETGGLSLAMDRRLRSSSIK